MGSSPIPGTRGPGAFLGLVFGYHAPLNFLINFSKEEAMRNSLWLVAVLALSSFGFSLAQNTRQDTVYSSISVNQMEGILKAAGYTYARKKYDNGGQYFQITIGKFDKVFLDFYHCQDGYCTDVGISAGFTMKNPPTIDVVNKYNYDYRFSKGYLDDVGAAWVDMDLDLQGGVTQAAIRAWLARFEAALKDFTKAIGFE